MKRLISLALLLIPSLLAWSQKESKSTQKEQSSLLWKITGNGIKKPSYLFGTIHMLCEDDAVLGDSLKKAISNCDNVYLEVQMDNMMEMIGLMGQLTMRGDTTLADLLSAEDYEKVKNYFEEKGSMLPFSMLETMKPILAASMLEESSMTCDKPVAMEQMIMEEAKKKNIGIKGLETMAYQASVLDSIPYKYQAMQLLSYIDSANSGADTDKEFNALLDAYKKQDLDKLEELMIKSDIGMSAFTDILLYNRNRNWVEKLKTILPQKSVVVAVGAGHLPGVKGVINLLRQAGFTVSPVIDKKQYQKTI
jgi:uncharacterized protein YbaP (TraB family)